MRLIGPAGLFAAGAGISYAGFVWKGATGRWPLFAGGFAAFIVGIASGKLPIFLLLFAATTAAFVFDATRGRTKPWTAGGFAISDLFLAAGITLHQIQSTQWDLPSPGEWGVATPLIAAAAALRFAGLVTDDGLDATGAASLGWWQGSFLAWWAGSSPVLVGLGLGVLVVCLLAREKQSTFVIAGGLACVLAGTKGDALPLLAAGTAATAFVLGERLVPAWALGALPLSLVSLIGPDEITWWVTAGSAAGIVGIAAAASTLCISGAWGGRLIAAIALAAAIISTGYSAEWWVYGLFGAGTLALLTTRPEDVPVSNIPVERLSNSPALPRGRWEVLLFAAWVILGVTVLVTLGLLVLGGRTGFL